MIKREGKGVWGQSRKRETRRDRGRDRDKKEIKRSVGVCANGVCVDDNGQWNGWMVVR